MLGVHTNQKKTKFGVLESREHQLAKLSTRNITIFFFAFLLKFHEEKAKGKIKTLFIKKKQQHSFSFCAPNFCEKAPI